MMDVHITSDSCSSSNSNSWRDSSSENTRVIVMIILLRVIIKKIIMLRGNSNDSCFIFQERFLTFCNRLGLGNQLLAMDIAIQLAIGLNRTLVVPDLVSVDQHDYYPYSTLFDFDGLSKDVSLRLVEMKDFLRLGIQPSFIWKIRGQRKNVSYYEQLGWHAQKIFSPINDSFSVEGFKSAFARFDEKLLAVEFLFYYHDNYRNNPGNRQRLASVVRPVSMFL